MRILSSTLGMDATTDHRDVQMTEGRLTSSTGQASEDNFQLNIPLHTSGYGRQATRVVSSSVQAVSWVRSTSGTADLSCSQNQVVGRMISEIVGQNAQIRDLVSIKELGGSSATRQSLAGVTETTRGSSLAERLTLSLNRLEYRQQKLSIFTAGQVETADGRAIGLTLELQLEEVEQQRQNWHTSMLAARFVDPLVLSFDNGLSVLDNSRFTFDLDGDGIEEEVGALRSGSGFLVLDKNNDGTVNSGHELFGPLSGHGYAELRAFDEDGNNWIDESDSIFGRLQLWMGGGSAAGSLVSLKEAGVGAIALASTETDFQLKDREGRPLGQVSRAGLFLTEAGEVRPLAEIDLAVDDDALPLLLRDFSEEVQFYLRILREQIVARRQQAALLAVKTREDVRLRHRGWLLERLFSFTRER